MIIKQEGAEKMTLKHAPRSSRSFLGGDFRMVYILFIFLFSSLNFILSVVAK